MPQRLSRFALATMVLPVLLGAALCVASPDRIPLWAIAMFAVPILLLATGRLRAFEDAAFGSSDRSIVERRRVISGAVVWACVVVSLPLSARLTQAMSLADASVADMIATRLTNLFASGFLILHGNRLPKLLTPLSTCSDPARIQAVRRRTGRAYVLAGLAFAIDWLVLPVPLAQPIGFAILVAGIVGPTLVMRSDMRHCLSHELPDIVGRP